MQSGRTVVAPDAGDHAAARKGGGARIDCPRVKVSTTRMAAPQCGQMNVGGTIDVDVCGGDGASTAGVTCN